MIQIFIDRWLKDKKHVTTRTLYGTKPGHFILESTACEEAYLVFDDTVIDKRHAKHIELVRRLSL